jgi:thymidine phosphorylase
MDITNFLNAAASGNAAEAKDVLNDLLSTRAFEALDAKKSELAHNLFSDGEQETEVQSTEEETAEE